MPFSAEDHRYLEEALQLARRGLYGTAPNPMVGAVVVKGGEVIGRGFHRRAGEPHAEAAALVEAGQRAAGATAYITLEPCCHQGRTAPCSDALLKAGVARVVACHRDPNPQVAGGGFRALRRGGVLVEDGLLAAEAVRLNLRFLTSVILERPMVTLKWAMSLDGRIATVTGESQWISGEEGRRWGLGQREEHDAILVGSGTVLADDPSLNRRLGLAAGPNLRVVLDRRLRTPPQARMFDLPGSVLIYTAVRDARAIAPLAARGAEVLGPEVWSGDGEQLSLETLLADLHRRGVQSLLVEGGGTIHAAFVQAGLFDRVAIDCAPLLVGGDGAPGPLRGAGADVLAQAPRLSDLEAFPCGTDLILEGMRDGCLRDLLQSVGA